MATMHAALSSHGCKPRPLVARQGNYVNLVPAARGLPRRRVQLQPVRFQQPSSRMYCPAESPELLEESQNGINLDEGTPLFIFKISDLSPTQLAVGMEQVHEKMEKVKKHQKKGEDQLDKFLGKNPVPVVKGPNGKAYLIDHHHLARAVAERDIKKLYVGYKADWSHLPTRDFWEKMMSKNYLCPFGPNGKLLDLDTIRDMLPHHDVADLVDDPYRSLAALVRKKGAYQKSGQPFNEFKWGNYLRSRVPMAIKNVDDVLDYVEEACHVIAEARKANDMDLPDACGPK